MWCQKNGPSWNRNALIRDVSNLLTPTSPRNEIFQHFLFSPHEFRFLRQTYQWAVIENLVADVRLVHTQKQKMLKIFISGRGVPVTLARCSGCKYWEGARRCQPSWGGGGGGKPRKSATPQRSVCELQWYSCLFFTERLFRPGGDPFRWQIKNSLSFRIFRCCNKISGQRSMFHPATHFGVHERSFRILVDIASHLTQEI